VRRRTKEDLPLLAEMYDAFGPLAGAQGLPSADDERLAEAKPEIFGKSRRFIADLFEQLISPGRTTFS
jgi:hypothetical protein